MRKSACGLCTGLPGSSERSSPSDRLARNATWSQSVCHPRPLVIAWTTASVDAGTWFLYRSSSAAGKPVSHAYAASTEKDGKLNAGIRSIWTPAKQRQPRIWFPEPLKNHRNRTSLTASTHDANSLFLGLERSGGNGHGGAIGSLKRVRMPRTAPALVMKAMTRISPPQLERRSGKTSLIRASSSAQA